MFSLARIYISFWMVFAGQGQGAYRITGTAFRSNNITLKNLTDLNFNECINLTDLRAIIEKCPNLQKLSLWGAKGLRGAAFTSNNIMLENLTELYLSVCNNLTDDNLRILLEKSPNLKKLQLTDGENIIGAAFTANSIRLDNLTSLYLTDLKNLKENHLAVLLEKCPNLRKISLHCAQKITGAAFRFDNIRLEKLRILDLSYCRNLTDDHLAVLLEKCPKLQRLDVDYSDKITDDHRAALKEKTKLITTH